MLLLIFFGILSIGIANKPIPVLLSYEYVFNLLSGEEVDKEDSHRPVS